MKADPDPLQTAQRLRVGLIGLVAVMLLIGLASAIIGTAAGPSVNAAADVAANLMAGNDSAAGEPLAELGAAPGAANDQSAAP